MYKHLEVCIMYNYISVQLRKLYNNNNDNNNNTSNNIQWWQKESGPPY